MKLSEKFARQESEEARLARVARRRIPTDRVNAIRRMLNVRETPSELFERRSDMDRSRHRICPECNRAFALPMHLGRHKKAKHNRSDAAHSSSGNV
jgi:hypothetical protein